MTCAFLGPRAAFHDWALDSSLEPWTHVQVTLQGAVQDAKWSVSDGHTLSRFHTNAITLPPRGVAATMRAMSVLHGFQSPEARALAQVGVFGVAPGCRRRHTQRFPNPNGILPQAHSVGLGLGLGPVNPYVILPQAQPEPT